MPQIRHVQNNENTKNAEKSVKSGYFIYLLSSNWLKRVNEHYLSQDWLWAFAIFCRFVLGSSSNISDISYKA